MKTELDGCYENLLNRLCYDGNNLTAELKEQFVSKRGSIETNSSSRNFKVVFSSVTSHLVIEEFAESVANLVKSNEQGFLQKIGNQSLTESLGLDVPEKYGNLNCYALITSHEILIVFCEYPPIIELINKQTLFTNLAFRQATREDLPEIVRMLADDFLGATRERYENPLPESYVKAFEEIEADKNNELIVALLSEPPALAGGSGENQQSSDLWQKPSAYADGSDKTDKTEKIVGTLQITFTPSISFQGGKRATIESVRVDTQFRGQGFGKELIKWAIERAREEKCFAIQLMTNAERKDAHRFYEDLGFKGSHLGMKLYLK